MKKKKVIISVISVILIALVVVGLTYAYFMFVTNSSNIGSTSGELDINYNISNSTVEGMLIPSATRSGGIMENVTAKLNAGSVDAAINLYITPTEITGLPSSALMWEVDVLNTSSTVINHYSGNFGSSTIDTPLKIVNAYDLTTNLLTFNIYIWLNGEMVTNENFSNDNAFAAVITADSVPITGEFND